jgi:carbon monoxide dehydrogenase subunit G
MQLEHQFSVPVPVDRAWEVLLDVERVAPCMPGATVDAVDGDSFTGQVKVKVGPITVSYAGKASFVEKDAATHRAVVSAKGRETRGSGTAAATVTASMTGDGDSTRVSVVTDLAITGRPAQFGRGVMNDVGNKLLGQFAACLADRLAGVGDVRTSASVGDDAQASTRSAEPTEAAESAEDQPPAAEPSGDSSRAREGPPESRPTPDTIDLFDVAGGSVLKRVAPIVVLVAVLALVWALARRRGRRS